MSCIYIIIAFQTVLRLMCYLYIMYFLVTTYLITMSMPSNHNWLHPSRNQSRNFLADYWFSEYSTPQNVTNCAIGTTPHLLQIKFYKSRNNENVMKKYSCSQVSCEQRWMQNLICTKQSPVRKVISEEECMPKINFQKWWNRKNQNTNLGV